MLVNQCKYHNVSMDDSFVTPVSTQPSAPKANVSSQRLSQAAGRLAIHALLQAYRGSSSDGLTDAEKIARAGVVDKLARAADQPLEQVRADVNRLLARCSKPFRAKESTDDSVTKHRYLLIEAYRCKQQNDDDLLDVTDLFDAFLADHALRDQYGIFGNMESDAKVVKETFASAFRLRSALINTINLYKLLFKDQSTLSSGAPDYPDTVVDAVNLINTKLRCSSSKVPENIRAKFWGLALKADDMMREARGLFTRFKKRADDHVSQRISSGVCFFSHTFLGNDIITMIAEHLGFFGAFAMLSLCRSFSVDETIKQLLPHLSIRSIDGRFPHGQQTVPGLGHCDVVRKNSLVHLYVDLVVTGIERPGVRTQTPTHANELCGWSDDPAMMRRDRILMREDARERLYRTAQDFVPEHRHFHMRLSARRLFKEELVCEDIALVYADTLQEVVNPGAVSPISVPHRMAIRQKRLHTYTAKDGVPYPAYSTLCVMQHAARDVPKLYMFKVVARGVYPDKTHGYSSKKLVAYSRPFAIVSNQHVFKRPRSPAQTAR
jgi:hypothetical protein